MGQLPDAVGSEIKHQDNIIILDSCNRAITFIQQDYRFNELIGFSPMICISHSLSRVTAKDPMTVDNGPPGNFNSFPALIAVHGIEAAGDGGQAASADPDQLMLQLPDIIEAAGGRGIPAIHKSMYINSGKAMIGSHFEQCQQVVHMAVHTTV